MADSHKKIKKSISTIIGSLVFLQILLVSILFVVTVSEKYVGYENLVYNNLKSLSETSPLTEYVDGSSIYIISAKPQLVKYVIYPNGKIFKTSIPIDGKWQVSNSIFNGFSWFIMVLNNGQWFNVSLVPLYNNPFALLAYAKFSGLYRIPQAFLQQVIILLPFNVNNGETISNYPTAIYNPDNGGNNNGLYYTVLNLTNLNAFSEYPYFVNLGNSGEFLQTATRMNGYLWVTNVTSSYYITRPDVVALVYFPKNDFQIPSVPFGKLSENYYGDYVNVPSYAGLIIPVNITNDMWQPLGIFSFSYQPVGSGFYVTYKLSPLYGYYTAPTGFLAPIWNKTQFAQNYYIVYRYEGTNGFYVPGVQAMYINTNPFTASASIFSPNYAVWYLTNTSKYNYNWTISQPYNQYTLMPLGVIHQQNFFIQLLIIPWNYDSKTGELTVALALVGSSDLVLSTNNRFNNFWWIPDGGYGIGYVGNGYVIYTISYFNYSIPPSVWNGVKGVMLAFNIFSNSSGDFISSTAYVNSTTPYVGYGYMNWSYYKLSLPPYLTGSSLSLDTMSYVTSMTYQGKTIPLGFPFVVFTGYNYTTVYVSSAYIIVGESPGYILTEIPTAYQNPQLGVYFNSPYQLWMPPIGQGILLEYVYDNPSYPYQYYGWLAIGNSTILNPNLLY